MVVSVLWWMGGLTKSHSCSDALLPARGWAPFYMNRKAGLDAARAAAICLVLLAHFAKSLEVLGVVGVELFFALSGFLIGGILYRNLSAAPRWSFEDVKIFWLRRWWRTLPNYYLFFLVSVVFHWASGNLPDISELLPFLLFSQNLVHSGPAFYGVSWSLCVEEWFYLLFPFFILVITLLGGSKRMAFCLATCIFLTVPPILRETMFISHDGEAVRMMTLPRLDAIFYGVAVAFIANRWRLSRSSILCMTCIGLLGLIGLFLVWVLIPDGPETLWFYRWALVVLPASFSLMLPALAAVESWPPYLAFLAIPVRKISLWSYSIYLSHIPVLFATYAAFGALRENAVVNLVSKAVGLIVCVGSSALIYHCFEARLMRCRPSEKPLM